MSEVFISVSIIGLDEVVMVARELPKVLEGAMLPVVQEMQDVGIEAARQVLIETSTSDKATGETARLMTGIIQESGAPGGIRLSIGPDTSHYAKEADRVYAKFVETGSRGMVPIGRNVQLQPFPLRMGFMPTGRWRFIGVRQTPIQPHPWMKGIREAILEQTAKRFKDKVYEGVGKLNRKTKKITFHGELYPRGEMPGVFGLPKITAQAMEGLFR